MISTTRTTFVKADGYHMMGSGKCELLERDPENTRVHVLEKFRRLNCVDQNIPNDKALGIQ